MTEDIRVFPRDVAAAGLCMAGAREWGILYNFSLTEFIKEGLPIEQLRATNCPLCLRACVKAEERARGTA